MTKIGVLIDVWFEVDENSSVVQVLLPLKVYEWSIVEDGVVEKWLSDNYGWLVRDWRLADSYSKKVSP